MRALTFEEAMTGPAGALDFDVVYRAHFHEVMRWARANGGARADLEDLSQEVFLVVRQKLDRFDGRNLRGWLFRITANIVSDYRRRWWFRNLFRRRADAAELEALDAAGPDPDAVLERKDAERRVHEILSKMSEKRRVTFSLYEIEGYTGEEIAELLGIPVKTVWTRLHHARREFLQRLEAEGVKP